METGNDHDRTYYTSGNILKRAAEQAEKAQEKNKVTKFIEGLIGRIEKISQEDGTLMTITIPQEKMKKVEKYIKDNIIEEYLKKIPYCTINAQRIFWLIKKAIPANKEMLINLFLSEEKENK